VTKLAGMISEAVPFVGERLVSFHFVIRTKYAVAPLLGPIIGHALPALGSIFGSSERLHDADRDLEISKFIAKQQDIVDLIKSMEADISNNNTAIMNALDEVKDHVDVAHQRDRVSKYLEVVDGVM
jgi:hypothetical protein